MKRILYKISSAIMAIVVLLSTMSFTVEKHFCGDSLVDISIVGNLERCNTDKNLSKTTMKNNCCKDEVYHIEGQDKLQKESLSKLSFEQQKVFVAFLFSYQSIYVDYKNEQSFYKDFSPPDLDRDIRVLYQTFLI